VIIVICHMTIRRNWVGAKTEYSVIKVVFEGSSLYLCFSTFESIKKYPFSTLKLV
jgi:hypothetical protein